MSKDTTINQRINKDTYNTVKFLKRWIKLSIEKDFNFSETVDYIAQDFIKRNDIIKKTDITEQDIKFNHNMMVKYRVDTNIPIDLRDDIKIIQYVLNKDRKEEERRLTIEDVIRTLVDKFMDLYPEIKQIKNEDKYIVQRIRLEEMRRRMNGLDPNG